MHALWTCTHCGDVETSRMKKFYGLQSTKNPTELAYVIGVLLGDGCVYRMKCTNNYTHKNGVSWRIELQVTDREFAERFAYSCGMILKRPERRRVKVLGPMKRKRPGKQVYRVCVASLSFGEWWKHLSNSEKLKFAIANPANFLRGLYDSEGNLSYNGKSKMPMARIFTCSKNTATIAEKCLEKLGMRSATTVSRKAGTKTNFGTRNLDLIQLVPRPARKFLTVVGSSIPRKTLEPVA